MESSFGLPFRPVLALAVPCPGFVPGALALSDPDRSGLADLALTGLDPGQSGPNRPCLAWSSCLSSA